MYDKEPSILVPADVGVCHTGWAEMIFELKNAIAGKAQTLCVECYPGVFEDEIQEQLSQLLEPGLVISTKDLFLSSADLNQRFESVLTGDPIFGMMNSFEIKDFLDPKKVEEARRKIDQSAGQLIMVIGTGAVEIAPQPDLLIYADLARWEIQKRQRQGLIGNLAADNATDSASLKYKRAFFLDWRAADRLKQKLLPRLNFLLDTNTQQQPKLITGDQLRTALRLALQQPFRVVPFFDPGPWGGHWMEEVCDLPRDAPNYAWCFDCVPEENSLQLSFGESKVEIPAINLVLAHPRELLGDNIFKHFGAEFPIRFDLLDTMGGGNLSLQVHPLNAYVKQEFGLAYTQDESYYMLDAEPGAQVYLGLKEETDPEAMLRDLEAAQSGQPSFDAGKYVATWPAKKHDHFLIPAGTIHCSGKGSMVLEISATPYIFTFKLWDWGRMGLDGKPRPINLKRGAENLQWNRTASWVKRSLINAFEPLGEGPGWREERTGLHELEFIETRRHWFTERVPHDTKNTVNVLNLVEGDEAIIESPSGSFQPFIVHYAETFIVPALVGAYTIRPHGSSVGKECATMKAFVRDLG